MNSPTHYLDLRVRIEEPGISFRNIGVAWWALHVHLGQNKITTVGVSFPLYSTERLSVGTILRIHGPSDELTKIAAADWLYEMKTRGQIAASKVLETPETNEHQIISRKRYPASNGNLERRRLKRTGDTTPQRKVRAELKLPSVLMNSQSTGQIFTMAPQITPSPEAKTGQFSCYGYSRLGATIPVF